MIKGNPRFAGMIIALVITATMLAGCQKTPETEIVMSKNTPSTSSESAIPYETTNLPINERDIIYKSSFDSTDSCIRFEIDINQKIPDRDLAPVQVMPHWLTVEDAKRCAYAIFPDTCFYEAEPLVDPTLTRSELQEKIALWSQYTNVDALRELWGDQLSEKSLSSSVDLIKSFIEKYTLKYEATPKDYTHSPCTWTMKKSSEYVFTGDELSSIDMRNDNDEIAAQCRVNGVPYYFTVSTHNKSDFKVNMISCSLFGGTSPGSIEDRIWMAKLCRTSTPTQGQIEAVQEKTVRILEDMQLGQWWIDDVTVETFYYGETPEYRILVNAVPLLNGTPAIRRKQFVSLRNQNGYAATQYFTDANFAFSPNGELLTCNIYTPLEVKAVVDEAKQLEIGTLLDRAKEQLKLFDIYSLPLGENIMLFNEEIQCNVSISGMKYGLSRIRIRDQEDAFLYVPALILEGNVEYIGKESGRTLYYTESPEILLQINTMDGTLINETNS